MGRKQRGAVEATEAKIIKPALVGPKARIEALAGQQRSVVSMPSSYR